ncbi:FxsB family cyclophane-forming radical SAM/SPASM peptide maturase [Paractinoplanes hotanensis]|uniref:FxsB family radical SAM/SPASM domain protein n=1 Tax=Paractinoplanes hotanensis TaxID=2906497 RepID=A0ABT0Y2A8_9ACTN|nr:FxsB family cyclophane-forming radical SAM/SPASM peptide maturase [Actinoplanes hotanensis]MCM4080161.1 FxsB family radical SAM/SPASM domain protein [Actinoplanes hotanensis]
MDGLWRPLRHFVLKVHSRCDLACDHCYIYEHADQSWRGRPVAMAPETVRAAAGRIAQHAARHGLARVGVVLHGGEPLLLGVRRLRGVLEELRGTITSVCELDLRMQTNGVRLDAATCELLLEHQVRVGVSLDGGRADNDRHRRYRNGASSHTRVLDALQLLRRPRYRPLYAGLLCTVDPANEPEAVYEALLAERPPRVDLLLPHATWDQPPAPVGSWLRAFHERWAADGRPVPVRLFDSIRSLGLGGPSGTEAVGLDDGDVVVIETDGAWEEPDSMKTTEPGGGATGLTVFDASADDVTELPAMRRRRSGLAALSATCRACEVVGQCGGGLTAHRWSARNGFDNPSVYCDDLKELIIAINEHPGPVAGDLGALPADAFDGLGYGYGDAATVALLADAELAVNRALLGEVVGETAAGGQLLAELERRAPEVFDEVLRHPFVRSWAVSCLDGGGSDCDPDWAAAIAAAVAVRAGIEVEVPVRAHGGRIHLPTVGFFAAPAAEVTVVPGPGGFTLRWPGGRTQVPGNRNGWHAARWVTVDGARILLEDADPYRDRLEHAAAGHLDAEAAGGWSAVLERAWGHLAADAPEQLGGLRQGVRAIVPLAPAPDGTLRSATSRHAFGALGLARADDPAAVAVLLVHEFQHTKLGAVLDLIDLVPEDAVAERLRVGWRSDPRPVEAALQGAYAHLAVADIWRRRDNRELFRMYRDWTAEAIDALRSGDRLTPAGSRFVARMADTVNGWGA